MSLRSFSDSSTLLRSGPAMTRSMDSSSAAIVICVPLARAVSSAPSLITLARSAPVNPAVRRAIRSSSTSGAKGLPRACTRRMPLRPARSGWATTIWRSNRPGRSSAGSRMSGRLVAAMTMTPPLTSNPSSSTSSWLRVCSRSSWPPPDRVDLVHEHDRRRVGLRLLEQVAHPGCADADEHLDEVGAGDGVERDAGLTGDRAREQGLAGPGRPVEQDALGDLGADRLELARALQELLDLLELLDRLVGPGHVGERGLGGVLGDELRLRLAEVHHPGAAALHLVEQEEEEQDDQHVGQEADDQAQHRVAAGHDDVVALRRHVLLQFGGQLLALVADPARLVVPAVLGDDLDGLVLVGEDGRLDVAVLDLLHDIRRVLLRVRGAAVGIRKHDEEEQQHHKDRYEGPAEIALQIHR